MWDLQRCNLECPLHVETGLNERLIHRSAVSQRLERLASLDENRRVARRGLVAADDYIDIERIQLDAATNRPGIIGGDEGRGRTKKRINDDVATIAEV